MASIYKEIPINVDSQTVWESVRDVGNVHVRLVPGYAAETHIEDDTRILTMSNGNIVRELIIGIDDSNYRLAYSVKDSQMQSRITMLHFRSFPKG
ncbi:MAG: hypothetical protein AB9891_06570 [Anaerolineaceae bacterium]